MPGLRRKRKRTSDGGDSGIGSSKSVSPASSTSSATARTLRRSERQAASILKKRKISNGEDDPEVAFNNNFRGQVQSPPKKRARVELHLPGPRNTRSQTKGSKKDQPTPATEPSTPQLPRRSPNGYLLPDPLPLGLTIRDLRGRSWRLGKSVGLGGFGEIYSANEVKDEPSLEQFVVKVEPFNNGPLFVEVNFYLRTCKKDDVAAYKEEKGLAHLGVPAVEGTGSFRHDGKRFRFLVIPRYGTDLQTLLDESKLTLSPESACQLACRVIDSYEYIHSKGYVHKDVKGSNLLFEQHSAAAGGTDGKGRKVFLVDYGLVSKYTHRGVHKPYVRDERCAHEGTLEYTARDFHLGCVSRRGDLEVLLYNVIDWTGGKLPWDLPTMPKPSEVHEAKRKAFHDPRAFMAAAYPNGGPGDCQVFLLELMEYISRLGFEEEPDYNRVRDIFTSRPVSSTSTHSQHLDSSGADEVTLSIEIRQHPPPLPSPEPDTKSSPPKKRAMRLRRRKKSGSVGSASLNSTLDGAASSEDEPDEEVVQRVLSDISSKRFEEESDAVIRASDAQCLLNPTPMMIHQMSKIRQRALEGPTASPAKGFKAFRKRNRSLSFSRSSMASTSRRSRKSMTPTLAKTPVKRMKIDRESPNESSPRQLRGARSEAYLTSKQQTNKVAIKKKLSLANLRRSPRILDPISVNNSSPRLRSQHQPNQNDKAKTSIRQNLINWFVNGTKSILRISNN